MTDKPPGIAWKAFRLRRHRHTIKMEEEKETKIQIISGGKLQRLKLIEKIWNA